jgi:hypothetical protein
MLFACAWLNIQRTVWEQKCTLDDEILKSRGEFTQKIIIESQKTFGTPLPLLRLALLYGLNGCEDLIDIWDGGVQPLRYAALASVVALTRNALLFSIFIFPAKPVQKEATHD